MNPEMNGQPSPDEQLQRMQSELQDAHLVIGQQQIQMLRLQAALRQQGEQMQEMQAKNLELESKTLGAQIEVETS